jgi:transcriptional regulator with XRE-family HTH domain
MASLGKLNPQDASYRVLDGAKVRGRRNEQGLTQKEAATRAEMTQQEWNRLERPGAHPVLPATAQAVSRALGVMVDQLVDTFAEQKKSGLAGDV